MKEITKEEIMEHNRKARIYWEEFDEWIKSDAGLEVAYAIFNLIKKYSKVPPSHLVH